MNSHSLIWTWFNGVVSAFVSSVGKTSLITRFMYDSFDNTYQVRTPPSDFLSSDGAPNSSYLLLSRPLQGHNRNRLPVENHVPWRQNSRCFCVSCYESWSDWSETNSVILRSSQVACALQLSVVQSATCTLCNASLVFPASTQVLSCPFWSSICFPCCFGTKDLQTEEGSLIASEGWLLI